jgi:serine-type D-Ala-D-Ala carboxypeptidase (penicillin-binding protein 5/6)
MSRRHLEEHTVIEHDDVAIVDEQITEIEQPGDSVAGDHVAQTYSTLPTKAQFSVAMLLLLGVFGFSYIPRTPLPETAQSSVEHRIRNEVVKQEPVAVVPEPQLEASAAYVWDVRHQRALYNKSANTQLPLASITKLMTSLVALETLKPDAKVPMTLAAISQDGPSDFRDGEIFGAQALSDFSLVSSSNDGEYALAAAAAAALSKNGSTSTALFIDAMNKKAEEIGLSQTYFINPTGLDESTTKSGAYGSARDMAFLMEYLLEYHPQVLEGTTEKYTRVRGKEIHTATNTNEIITQIPGVLASKTGYTDLAGGNLLIAFDAGLNRPVIVSVLGSSREGRFKDVAALISYAQKRIASEEKNP